MPNRISAILHFMRQYNIRPNQIVRHEVINPDDDPNDWVNQGDADWQPGQWVDGELVDSIYKKLYADLREQGKHLEADPAAVFEQAFQRAEGMEQAITAAAFEQVHQRAQEMERVIAAAFEQAYQHAQGMERAIIAAAFEQAYQRAQEMERVIAAAIFEQAHQRAQKMEQAVAEGEENDSRADNRLQAALNEPTDKEVQPT